MTHPMTHHPILRHSRPNVQTLVLKPDPKSQLPVRAPEITFSLEWDRMYPDKPENVKKIRQSDGYELQIDRRATSRLSKLALFTVYKRILNQRRLGREATETTYAKTKRQARDYYKCKKWLYNRWLVDGEGEWIRHPEAESRDNFSIQNKPPI
jgi:hypothetical protein